MALARSSPSHFHPPHSLSFHSRHLLIVNKLLSLSLSLSLYASVNAYIQQTKPLRARADFTVSLQIIIYIIIRPKGLAGRGTLVSRIKPFLCLIAPLLPLLALLLRPSRRRHTPFQSLKVHLSKISLSLSFPHSSPPSPPLDFCPELCQNSGFTTRNYLDLYCECYGDFANSE